MGLEDRDWYRAEMRRQCGRRSPWPERIAVAIVVGVIVALVRAHADGRLDVGLPFGGHSPRADIRAEPIPGAPGITLRKAALYPADDPWRAWLASERACPGGEDVRRPAAAQVRTMFCLLNFARAKEGLRPLALSSPLGVASMSKADAIVRCNEFAHEPCGEPGAQAARRLGYRGSWGENLYVAEGPFVAPRVAVDGWLNSAGHRRNLFRPAWRTVGIARRPGSDVERIRDGVVWVTQFGD